MSFKSRKSVYSICYATGRAKCRSCKVRIPQGTTRITTDAFVCPGRYTQFSRCVSCINSPFAKAVLAVYGTASKVSASVSEEEAEKVRNTLEQLANGASVKPQRSLFPC